MEDLDKTGKPGVGLRPPYVLKVENHQYHEKAGVQEGFTFRYKTGNLLLFFDAETKKNRVNQPLLQMLLQFAVTPLKY